MYQQKRIHSSLGYVTPEEFELQWKSVHSHHEIPLSKGVFVSSFMSPVHSPPSALAVRMTQSGSSPSGAGGEKIILWQFFFWSVRFFWEPQEKTIYLLRAFNW